MAKSTLGPVLLALLWLPPAAAAPFARTLISQSKNVHVEAWQVTGKEVTPDRPGWSVRLRTLHGGKQEGVSVIEVDNGKLRFTVIPTRGMGIRSARLGDVRLGWDSPVQEVVHPAFINLHSRGGLGWLEGFNEWLCRCGLESNGHPGTDRFINNVGEPATMELTLHGRVANLPAQEVELVVDRRPPYRIRVRGRVDERMFYGPKLELQTEIATEPGSNSLRVTDVVTNRGAQPQEFQMLYHVNFGPPLLEKGATFLAPVARVTPFNAHAARGVRDFARYAGPVKGFVEQVYCLRLHSDPEGSTTVLLRNRAGDRAVSMSYAVKELPYFTLWKNTAAEADGYVTGLEPGTNFPNNRRVERKLGRVPKLAAGASHRMAIEFTVHVGRDQVNRVAERIQRIQGKRVPIVDERPEPKD
jgi:galactose mutarotase-like enzyme